MARCLPKYSQTRLVVWSSAFIVILGIGLLWFGLQPVGQVMPQTVTTSAESTSVEENTAPEVRPEVVGIEGERMLVTKVIDGDTFEIEGGLKVRMLGIDTPETVDTRKPVGCFGKEASNEVKNLLSEQVVILQKDLSNTDKYNRLLRYVFLSLEDGKILFVNDYLLREGFAQTLNYPPDVKYAKQFLEAEEEAKMGRRGLWEKC